MKQRILILGFGRMGHAMEHLLTASHDERIRDIGGVIKGSVRMARVPAVLIGARHPDHSGVAA